MPGHEWMGEAEKKQLQDVLDTGILFRYELERTQRHLQGQGIRGQVRTVPRDRFMPMPLHQGLQRFELHSHSWSGARR